MDIEEQIKEHIDGQPEPKHSEIKALHHLILDAAPGCRLWFSDGRNEEGKVVSNPSIGYGQYMIHYADGTTKEFFRIGLSGNTGGISVYVMGLDDKSYLKTSIGHLIGKATVTGYCIKFKKLQDIDVEVLMGAIRYGLELPG